MTLRFFIPLFMLFSQLSLAADNQASCEILYAAHPHKHASEAIGEQRLERTLELDFEQMSDYSELFIPLTSKIARAFLAGDGGDTIELTSHKVVLGGYEGESAPSVMIEVTVKDRRGYQELIELAAAIGYVYAQDSTLVICTGDLGDQWQSAVSLEVTDTGREALLTEESIPIVYGMMIGIAGSVDDLGYTYYEDRKLLSSLAESDRDVQEQEIWAEIAQWVNTMSNGDMELAIDERNVSIFFPHNDWDGRPSGGNYLEYLSGVAEAKNLEAWRKEFLQKLDSFLLDQPLPGVGHGKSQEK